MGALTLTCATKPQNNVKPLLSQFLQAYNELLRAKKGTGITSRSVSCSMDDLYRVNKLIRLSHFMIGFKADINSLASDGVIKKDYVNSIAHLLCPSHICYIL